MHALSFYLLHWFFSMPSVHSRPVIESDGNNLALRRVIRFLKRMITKITEVISEGSLVTEELLDALGAGVIQLFTLLGYPLKYVWSMPEIFRVFTDKPLPMTLPLIFVLHIILLIYSSYVLCYMPAVGLAWNSAESISFHLITALAIISYYRGVVTDPGRIPDSPEWSDKQNIHKKNEGLRFCPRDKKWKPERTHYCSAIGRNVLKMDHYCPWLANCVGFFNHKFFLLFILYATCASGWATVASAHLLATSSMGPVAASLGVIVLTPPKVLSAAQVFFLTEGLCISSLISLILTPFTCFHLFLVARNQTTLEYCEGVDSGKSFDFGIFSNYFQIFGYNPLFWFLPIQSVSPAEGLQFPSRPTVQDDESQDEEEARIVNEFEKRDFEKVAKKNPSCCIRSWDDPSSNWLLNQCSELNAFREKLAMNFFKILT